MSAPTSSSRALAFAAAFAAALLMGSLGLFVKESGCSAEGCALARFAIGLLLLTGLSVAQRALRAVLSPFSPSSALSGLSIALCILFYFMAMERIPIGLAALLLYTGPLFAALGEALVARRCPGRRELLLLAAAAAGIVLVSCGGAGLPGAGGSARGLLLGLLSGLFYAGYILLNRLIPEQVPLTRRTFWQFAAGTLVLLLPMLHTEAPFAGLSEGWPFVLCIGVLQGFAVLLLVAYAVRRLNAVQYGSVSYLEPVVAVALGWALYHESMQLLQWLGVALVIAASLAQSLLPPKQS